MNGYGGTGSNPYNMGNIIFSDAGVPISIFSASGGTFSPTAGDPGSLPAPAPSGPYNLPAPGGIATLASIFNGINPNGTWKLYEYFNYVGTNPTLIQGWCLNFTLNTPPVITTNPINVNVNAGTTATFTAAASGNPTPSVQWQVSSDGGSSYNNISGATSATLSFTTSTGQNGNLYRAAFTNASGLPLPLVLHLQYSLVQRLRCLASPEPITFVQVHPPVSE